MPWLAFHRFGAPPHTSPSGFRSFLAFWMGGGSAKPGTTSTFIDDWFMVSRRRRGRL